jgi:hypothetical protein
MTTTVMKTQRKRQRQTTTTRRKTPNPLPLLRLLRRSLWFESADLVALQRTNRLAGTMRSREIALIQARPPRGGEAGADLDEEVVAGRGEEAHPMLRSNPSIKRAI